MISSMFKGDITAQYSTKMFIQGYLIGTATLPGGPADKIKFRNVFFIPEFERAAKIRKIAVYRFLTTLLVPEL